MCIRVGGLGCVRSSRGSGGLGCWWRFRWGRWSWRGVFGLVQLIRGCDNRIIGDIDYSMDIVWCLRGISGNRNHFFQQQ